MNIIKDTATRITKLQIQGATNIAIQAVKALAQQILETPNPTPTKLNHLIQTGTQQLAESRATEPMMRNGLRYLGLKISKSEWNTKNQLDQLTTEYRDEVLDMFNSSKKRIAKIGAKRIRDGYTILTHCHSSATTGTLIEAKRQGINFKVIQTETRPKYQGRITAIELVEAGIETTMIVDSAARHYMRQIDFVILGSDAITSEGNIINKIGSSQIALAAHEARVPFYVVSTLLKFDPVTLEGEYETIEERSTDEIWDNPPKGLIIKNPAFDITVRDYIHGIISEAGIISPHSIIEAIHRHYPWILE